MSFLRLGTACAVFNENGEILLSQRRDLEVWALPGGRLDKGERIEDAALREVREETGIEAEIVRPVGLYYVERWRRMNVVFAGRATGGTLNGLTYETRDNRWFAPDALPETISRRVLVDDALNGGTHLHAIPSPLGEHLRMRWFFGLRWVMNLLRGKPEPRYPRFDIYACDKRTGHRVRCDGSVAPWQALCSPSDAVNWTGTQQHQNTITFVFSSS